MDKFVIYPGTFDPFHPGHLKVITRVLNEVPGIVKCVVLLQNNKFKKNIMFTKEYRLNLIKNKIIDNKITVEYTEFDHFNEWLMVYLHQENLDYEFLDINVVIGDDTLDTLSKWNGYNIFKNEFNFIIVQRSKSFNEITKLANIDLGIRYQIIQHDEASTKVENQYSSTEIKSQVNNIVCGSNDRWLV